MARFVASDGLFVSGESKKEAKIQFVLGRLIYIPFPTLIVLMTNRAKCNSDVFPFASSRDVL